MAAKSASRRIGRIRLIMRLFGPIGAEERKRKISIWWVPGDAFAHGRTVGRKQAGNIAISFSVKLRCEGHAALAYIDGCAYFALAFVVGLTAPLTGLTTGMALAGPGDPTRMRTPTIAEMFENNMSGA